MEILVFHGSTDHVQLLVEGCQLLLFFIAPRPGLSDSEDALEEVEVVEHVWVEGLDIFDCFHALNLCEDWVCRWDVCRLTRFLGLFDCFLLLLLFFFVASWNLFLFLLLMSCNRLNISAILVLAFLKYS